jgi:hypothetical protein
MGRRLRPVLAALGFKALATTTSSGFAFTLGRLDGKVRLAEVVAHAGAIDRATDLPVSVDLENGYGSSPGDVAGAISRVAGAGAVGGSIEDYDPAGRLGFAFTLTARAENPHPGPPRPRRPSPGSRRTSGRARTSCMRRVWGRWRRSAPCALPSRSR